MANTDAKDQPLKDEMALRWSFLEDEDDPCVVVSQRMEFVYVNSAARALVPDGWFGKRCFEVLPIVDENCAFHCPKIEAVNEASEVAYCEETVFSGATESAVLGVGLIPLGASRDDQARAVFLLRDKRGSADESDFKEHLLHDAERVRQRIVQST